ncbi:4Fe-4S ferredoxin, iron-sulfur binding domain protein [Citrifermentans bremense]|uniref:4Fe-4S ferredoxin, iron-sulfur binding domain protein n=1 Tax=Citrifermentans bremense TaxID=60035 RepID=A0A7R7IYH4_9BACT|nr:4Fe-4S binding protein [Citrifermentans bremense]BCO11189.1 4Fe-4S ferredoxin, iron-sulfur binding domain protein [Citrifermentans bremense]
MNDPLQEESPPVVDTVRCTGCGRCVAACGSRLLSLEVDGFRKYAQIGISKRCKRCLACAAACPVRALRAD